MNKEIRKVELISRNVLESLVYYSRFNPLYFSSDYLSKDKFQNEKGWRGVYYPLSPPLVSPETKFFCKKKKSVQIGRAMRIAPAEK